jgi:hypothetical protein
MTDVKTYFKQPTSKRGAATPEELDYMSRGKMLPCRACGKHGPNQWHHVRKFGGKKNHKKGFSLCEADHMNGYPNSLHSDRKGWEAKHGTEESHVKATRKLLEN